MNTDETELIAHIVNGDQEAYRALVDRYKQDIYRHCFYIIRDEDSAEDMAQEAFIKAYANLQKYDASKANFKTWLSVIATRQCLSYLRRHKSLPLSDEDIVISSLAASFAVVALTAGTSFAAVQWLQPKATVDSTSGITTLANGNKRFWIDYASCQGQRMPEQHRSYYEIAANSQLTPDELTKSLEASCEADLLDKLFPEVVSNAPKGQEPTFKPGQEQYFTPYVTLKSIGSNYLVVDSMLNGEKFTDVRLPLDNTDRLYEKGEKIDLAKFHAGDSLTLITHTTSLSDPYSTETLKPEDLSKISENGFPRGTTVKGAIKRQYDMNATNKAWTVMGTDWTRLVEGKTSPDGWKQLVPFDHKYPQQ